jgi:hypothetical protein
MGKALRITIFAPFSQVRFWHFVLGALVAVIAGIELWQDRQAKT